MKNRPAAFPQQETILGLTAIVLWSATVALARSISERVGPAAAGAAVYLAAAAFLAAELALKEGSFKRLLKLPRRYAIGCGALFVLYTLALFLVVTQGTTVSWVSFSRNIQSNPIAYGLGALAAIAWALYSNLTRRWGPPNSRGAVLLFTLATGVSFVVLRLLRPE
jgi:drug/metabolite transporter (DMT)-like permease